MTSKPSLVFIPGWGSDQRCWEKLSALLQPYFNCSYVELPYQSASLGDWQHELKNISQQVPEHSVIVAWSLGGMLATQLAKRYPHCVSKLVLIAVNPSFVAREHWPSAMPVDTFNAFCAGFDASPEKTIKKFNALQAQGYNNRKEMLKVFADLNVLDEGTYKNAARLLGYLSEIDNTSGLFELSQSVLNIFSENDALVPFSSMQDVASVANKNNLNIENKLISECGHAPHISHTENVFELLSAFLNIDDDRYKRDKKKVAESFSKASVTYDSAALLQRKVATKLCAWSADISGRVLDLGCGTGYCLDILRQRAAVTELIGLDIASSMLAAAKTKLNKISQPTAWCNADLEHLPFCDQSMNSLVSSLAIQWSDQLAHVFGEAARVLDTEGRFVVSSLGPETLWELNKAWAQAEPEFIHINRFTEACEVMAAASDAGFEVELFSVDYEILQYQYAIDLMKDLKAIGAHNLNSGSRRGLTGKKALALVESAYGEMRTADGALPATYQVYYWVFKKRRVLS